MGVTSTKLVSAKDIPWIFQNDQMLTIIFWLCVAHIFVCQYLLLWNNFEKILVIIEDNSLLISSIKLFE